MKNLDFQDYTATVEDSDGDDHESTVRAAVITDELVYLTDEDGNKHRREVMTPTGARGVQAGDVFVETEKPGVYDYLSAAAWASTGYSGEVEEQEDSPAPAAKKTAAKRTLPGENS